MHADKAELRDHAKDMLLDICVDLNTDQSQAQEREKSQGQAPAGAQRSAPKSHALSRMQAGFTVEELMAEYRALRASVLRLWHARMKQADESALQDMLRFNEAIDQSLTESLAYYAAMLRDSQNVFLAILGHDVRNPLGAISMGAQIMLQDTDLPKRHVRVADQMLRSTQRVNEIVSDLLDYSTSHLGGGIPVTLADYDLAAECRSVVDEMMLFHPNRSFVLDVADDITVTWDRARISQALSNLIANAVQHGDAATPVWISVGRAGDQISLMVQNEGIPISLEKLRTMFDPAKSFAIKSIKERSASQTINLGLGLYITHEIVIAHSGQIAVTSTETEGTTITAVIPAAPPAQRRPAAPRASR